MLGFADVGADFAVEAGGGGVAGAGDLLDAFGGYYYYFFRGFFHSFFGVFFWRFGYEVCMAYVWSIFLLFFRLFRRLL